MKVTAGAATPAPVGAELLAALDEEISRLPEKYRAPVVLCDLGGLGRHDAAGDILVAQVTPFLRLGRGGACRHNPFDPRGVGSFPRSATAPPAKKTPGS